MRRRSLLFVAPGFAVGLMLLLASLALAAPFTLSGHVTDQTSTGIVGATVDALQPGTTTVVTSTSTGANGAYSLSLDAGTYDVRVTPPTGSGFQVSTVTNVAVTADRTLDIALVPGAAVTLSGRVLDAQGVAVPGRRVNLTPAGGGSVVFSDTNASGAYSIQVAPGAYDVTTNTCCGGSGEQALPGGYGLSGGRITVTQSITLDLPIPAKRVSVRVQDPTGAPVANAEVSTSTVFRNNLTAGTLTFNSANSSDGATTNAAGDALLWLFATEPTGQTYTFTARPPAGSPFATTNRSGIPITDDESVTITLAAAVTVSGRVLDAQGVAVPGRRVNLTPAGGGSVVFSDTNASGAYSIQVAPGAYDVTTNTCCGGSGEQALPGGYGLSGGRITVTQSITLDLPIPAKRVSVRVQDPTGAPVANAEVSTSTVFRNNLTAGTLTFNSANSSDGATTNAAGDALLWLFATEPTGQTYTFTARPPAGSPFATTNRSGIPITDDESVTITLAAAVTVSGRVLDAQGVAVPGRRVNLTPAGGGSVVFSDTNASGAYSIQVAPGAYDVTTNTCCGGSGEQALPGGYGLSGGRITVTQSITLDLPIPAKRVSVRVQDPTGAPVANAEVSTSTVFRNNLTAGTLTFNSANSSDGATTNAAGDALLWLFATEPTGQTYTFTARPPTGSPFATVNLPHVAVDGDKSLVLALQFVHAPPVTTATFSPPAVNGIYTSSPVTVTLSATAASGFTVASTKYTIDNGPEQTYTAPFPISGDGTHTLRYWSVDNLGVFESPKTATLQIQSSNPTPTISGLSPSSAQSGGPAFTLTVNGTGFVPTSKVHWNGSERPTTYVSATQLTAQIAAADIASPGSPKVTVVSPAPGGGTSNEATFTVTQGNRPPTANAGGPYNVPAGASVQLSGSGADPDGDTVTFAWDLDNNGSFETPGQSPTFSAAGLTPGTSKTVALQVCDSDSLCTNSAPATINVVSTLQITTASPLPSGTVGQSYTVTLQAAGGQEPYRWSVASGNLPPGLNLNENTGVISGTPTNGGTYGFTIRVTDSSQVAATKSFTLTPPPTSGPVGQPYPPTPIQPQPPAPGDGSPPPACTNYRLAAGSILPSGMSLDPVTGTLSGTPTNGGTFQIIVECTYNTNQTATADFTITINNPVPTLTVLSPNTTTAGGAQFTLTLTGTQFVEGATVRWNTTTLEVLSRSATQITAKVTPAEIATVIPVSVTVVNPGPGGGPSNALPFTITQSNRPPTAGAGGPYSGAEGASITLNASASDPENDALTVSWAVTAGTGTDPGAACQVTNGATLTPTIICNDDGSFTAKLTVNDSKNAPVTSDAVVAVSNVAPTITAVTGQSNVITGVSTTFTGTATDPSSLDTAAGFSWQWAVDGGAYSAFSAPKDNTFKATLPSCGNHTIGAKAKDDDDGVSAPFTTSVVKTYNLAFEQPLDEGVNNVVQKGRVVPVKISIGCGSASLTGLNPTIILVKGNVSPGSETATDEVTAYSSSAADTTGVMRASGGGYMYNLRVPDDATVKSGDKFTIRVRPFGDNNPDAAKYIVLVIK